MLPLLFLLFIIIVKAMLIETGLRDDNLRLFIGLEEWVGERVGLLQAASYKWLFPNLSRALGNDINGRNGIRSPRFWSLTRFVLGFLRSWTRPASTAFVIWAPPLWNRLTRSNVTVGCTCRKLIWFKCRISQLASLFLCYKSFVGISWPCQYSQDRWSSLTQLFIFSISLSTLASFVCFPFSLVLFWLFRWWCLDFRHLWWCSTTTHP